jgi:hypothetical protein
VSRTTPVSFVRDGVRDVRTVARGWVRPTVPKGSTAHNKERTDDDEN